MLIFVALPVIYADFFFFFFYNCHKIILNEKNVTNGLTFFCLFCLCNIIFLLRMFLRVTFLTEHAVAEDDLGEERVVLQCSPQHAAGVHADALPAQVQSAAARRRPRVVQLSQH